MKTSTFFVMAAILSAVGILTAGNLKLKNEFSSGHIHDAFVKTTLPPFHYIAETLHKDEAGSRHFRISDSIPAESSMRVFFGDMGSFRFKVVNDTLFLYSNPSLETNRGYPSPVYINTPGLKSLKSSFGNYTVLQNHNDSLSIDAAGKSNIVLQVSQMNHLSVIGSANAGISLKAADTVGSVSVRIKNNSCFYADNVLIKQKNIKLSDQASLQLSGISLSDFGLKSE
jgi:hypothetical protein